MLHLIPNDLPQALEKLAWLKANGYNTATRESVINDMTQDGVQDMLDTALEGPYWGTAWKKPDMILTITGSLGKEIAKVYPRKGFETFSQDLADNDLLYWRNLSAQVSGAIGND